MASTPADVWVVCLEIKRIQTWLFAVPKLQAMVGANAILAKLLSRTLVELAKDNGAALPVGVDRTGGKPAPVPIPGDPLAGWDRPLSAPDDPVLVRHAGRFHACFRDRDSALAFAQAAAAVIGRDCGDVRAQFHIEPLHRSGDGFAVGDREEVNPAVASQAGLSALESSLLQPCEASGVGIAARRVGGRQGSRKLRVSQDVVRRRNAFLVHDHAEGDDRDLVKRFYQGIPGSEGLRQPNDFKGLADDGYLGVLCADGNNVGAGLKAALNEGGDDYFAQWARSEAYFLRTRSRIRAALATALAAIPGLAGLEKQTQRYRMLMLGGDDILLVARADRVLQLAARFCKALDELNADRNRKGTPPPNPRRRNATVPPLAPRQTPRRQRDRDVAPADPPCQAAILAAAGRSQDR